MASKMAANRSRNSTAPDQGEEVVTTASSNSDGYRGVQDEVYEVKSEPSSPDGDASRSINGSCPSEPVLWTNSDAMDDAAEGSEGASSAKDLRRFAHSVAEQKRRDAIKKGYDDLQMICPTCHMDSNNPGTQKLSKAIILQRTIEYMKFLHQQRDKQKEDLEALRKEVMALKIMKTNYEQIAKAHQNQPSQGQKQVSDQAKFSVFKQIMDTQFVSFDSAIAVTSFDALSACVFSWLEEYCKPQYLREIVIGALMNLKNHGLLQS